MSVKSSVTVPDGSALTAQSCAACRSMSRGRADSSAATSPGSCASGAPTSATNGSTCSTPIGSAAQSTGCDAVFHVAALYSFTAPARELEAVNVAGHS